MRRELAKDQWIAALAAAQGGAVSRRQLEELGVSLAGIDHRLRAGRLHLVHRGVYAVGHRLLSADGRLWAAVLACGDGAVLSHWSAAGAWALRRNGRDAIDVTVGPGGRAPRTGISVHRSTTLTPEQALTRGGLPITTPGRTVLDLAAAGVTELQLEELLDRAERLLFGFDDLHAVLAAHPRRPGAPALRALLSEYDPGATATRSEMERRFLRLCDRHGIARPRVNGIVEGFEVDFTWRRQRLVVEVDGYAFHSSRTAFETDRARDVRLVLSGFRVLRFTWRQLTRRGSDVAKGLRHALSTS